MIFAFVLLFAFSQVLDEGSPAPAPADRERDGLVAAVRQVVEDRGDSHSTTKTYDAQGNIASESERYGGYTMSRRYKPDVNGATSMCYEAWSMINSTPPPIAAHPVSKQGCGEAYSLRREYRLHFARVGTVVSLAASTLEEKATTGQELAWRTKYFYDAQGRLTKAVGFNVLNAFVQTHLYTYKDKSKAPETYERLIDDETVLKEWYEYEFDDKGNWIKRETKKREAVGYLSTGDVVRRAIKYY